MKFKDKMAENITQPITWEFQHKTVLARVLRADSDNNVCDIRYTDKYGRLLEKKNVIVRSYGQGNDWFPERDDRVEVDISNDTCVIISSNSERYKDDMASKNQLNKDNITDMYGCLPGGYCF